MKGKPRPQGTPSQAALEFLRRALLEELHRLALAAWRTSTPAPTPGEGETQ